MTHAEKVLRLLSDGKPHGHMEGYRLGVMLHSRVADLRKPQHGGHDIRCWRDGENYMYQLHRATVREGEVAADGGAANSASPLEPSPPDGSATRDYREASTSRAGVSISPDAPAQLTVWEAAA